MNLTLRLLLFGAVGLAFPFISVLANGWMWDWSAHTMPGNIVYVVGRWAPSTVIALLIGYFTRKRRQSNSN
jgi:hypothetical protein